jgi:2'-5' RNA ligase
VYFGLLYYPDVGATRINEIRRKYDPTVDVIEPHLTIVFPVPEAVGEKPLLEHITSILQHWRPFPIRLHGFQESPDHWLFLTVDEGNSDIVRLFEEMYTGRLEKYRRHDIEFVPHIGLGLFVKRGVRYDMAADPDAQHFDEPAYQGALREANAAQLNFRCTVSKLDMVEIPDEIIDWALGKRAEFPSGRPVVTRKEFAL